MRIAETAKVLAKIQAFNNRGVDEAVITTWHEILEPYLVEDCLRAVTDHFRHSKEWIMPVDIIRHVNEYQTKRLSAFPGTLRLSDDDERAGLDSGEWREANKRIRRLAANGHITPKQYDDYHAGNLRLDQLGPKEITG